MVKIEPLQFYRFYDLASVEGDSVYKIPFNSVVVNLITTIV